MLLNLLKEHDDNFKDENKMLFSEHHLSHAASAFYPSPFNEAVVLTADGVGEWATTTVAVGKGNKLNMKKEIHFPHSLGLLYSAFTYYTGFKVNSGEYKLMGLAPYGEPKYYNQIKDNLIDIKNDGSFRLNQDFFNYATGLTMTNNKFHDLFGKKPRNSKQDKITQFHMDIAASIQKVTEDIMLSLAISLRQEFNIPNLCLAGGVALNCVANGKILKEKIFDNIWIQPAAGDAGGSLGAALAFWHIEQNKERKISNTDDMQGSYLGPQYSQKEVEKKLNDLGAKFEILNEENLINRVTEDLSKGNVIGWFQGRMEFGPRALGSRSILFHTKDKSVNDWLNNRLKRTEFMPFAPVTTEKLASKCFEDWNKFDLCAPFMTRTFKCKKEFARETANQTVIIDISTRYNAGFNAMRYMASRNIPTNRDDIFLYISKKSTDS